MKKQSNSINMIEKFRSTVSFKKFIEDGDKFKKDDKINSYKISYPHFLKYFEDKANIDEHNLIIGINFVYGWMPTIFNYCSASFKDALVILNRAKQGYIPTKSELDSLKGLFNNSLVGTSKLLHFINPECFAIWDSKVYKYLTKNNANQNSISKSESYLAYLEFCKELTEKEEYKKIHSQVCNAVGYEMTKFRTAELIMFSTKNDDGNEE